jgi:hypothetical protein
MEVSRMQNIKLKKADKSKQKKNGASRRKLGDLLGAN